MRRLTAIVTLMLAICSTGRATIMLRPLPSAETAIDWADLVAFVKVTEVRPATDNGRTQEWASIVTAEVLTRGVSAKDQITVLWNQRLADATLTTNGPPKPPKIGLIYRIHLRDGWPTADFNPVDAVWGFILTDKLPAEEASHYIEHTVKQGDTLWSIAQKYYGAGQKWRVLRVANFTKHADGEVYPLRPGMRIRIPTFPMKQMDVERNAQQTPGGDSQPARRGSRTPQE